MGRSATMIIGGIALFAAGLVVSGLRVAWQMPFSHAQTNGLNVTPAPPQTTLAPEEVYARAAQAANKSVVNIDRTDRVQMQRSMFDDFFGDGRTVTRDMASHGSGVIITRDGYILTNEHVVGAANAVNRKISVTLLDGRKFQGTVVGADHTTDVALVKVDGKDLPAAQVGTVRGVIPGQIVVALGNPLELRFTVSHGVISALNRPIQVDDRIYADMIQHDALINPGNSGGALVNLQGKVIGINSLVRPDAQGIGFAIPIDTALRVADELKRFGKVKRPWLGLITDTNNAAYVRRYGVASVEGAVIMRLFQDGPAIASGLEAGDVIVAIDGKAVNSGEQVKELERKLSIRQQVSVEVARRDGTRTKLKVTAGEAP